MPPTQFDELDIDFAADPFLNGTNPNLKKMLQACQVVPPEPPDPDNAGRVEKEESPRTCFFCGSPKLYKRDYCKVCYDQLIKPQKN